MHAKTPGGGQGEEQPGREQRHWAGRRRTSPSSVSALLPKPLPAVHMRRLLSDV